MQLGRGGGEDFRPLALKKPLRKTCLPGIFNLLLVGHSNVIIILDLPVLLELNNINQNFILDKRELTSSSDIRSSKAS